jgi:hypothetical protein
LIPYFCKLPTPWKVLFYLRPVELDASQGIVGVALRLATFPQKLYIFCHYIIKFFKIVNGEVACKLVKLAERRKSGSISFLGFLAQNLMPQLSNAFPCSRS